MPYIEKPHCHKEVPIGAAWYRKLTNRIATTAHSGHVSIKLDDL